jgi:hypothetical protein
VLTEQIQLFRKHTVLAHGTGRLATNRVGHERNTETNPVQDLFWRHGGRVLAKFNGILTPRLQILQVELVIAFSGTRIHSVAEFLYSPTLRRQRFVTLLVGATTNGILVGLAKGVVAPRRRHGCVHRFFVFEKALTNTREILATHVGHIHVHVKTTLLLTWMDPNREISASIQSGTLPNLRYEINGVTVGTVNVTSNNRVAHEYPMLITCCRKH